MIVLRPLLRKIIIIIIIKLIFNTAPPTNLEIQKYYKNETRSNGVYSTGNLHKVKDGANIINLDEYCDIGTHWVALYVQNNNSITYFVSFGAEHIPKEIKAFINNKNIKTNILEYKNMIR